MNTRNIYKVIVAALLSTASMCLAIEGTWTRKSDMPTARSGLCASVVDGKIYAMGGGPSTGVVTTTVEQYDPATDTWTRKANMRIPRGFFGASTVNGKIYVVGGYGSGGIDLASVEEYDPVLDTWTIKASMPTARDQVATVAIAGKIYAVGGLSSDVSVRALEEYDPASDIWTRRSDMPTARLQVSCSTVEGILFAIGGASGMGGSALSAVEAYDPTTDTWTTKAPMPTARGFFSTCVVNGKIFAIGGCPDPYNSSELSSVEMYDPATDTWTIMDDMPTARKALATASVNGKIYTIGGQPVAGWDAPLSTVEEYQLIPPPLDFNGNGLVDIKDLLRLIGSWNMDDPSADIAPAPFGDGIVDALDLELLMSYWQQPVDDPTLIAHWAMDEEEGIIAHDSVGNCDAYLMGDPIWQPDAGQIGGALIFDGVDDYVLATLSLSPADGTFSVFGWIKGEVPGQVIISQSNGANWLGADPDSGCLMTELIPPAVGRFTPQPLKSEYIITDGQWHRVGFVWDGINRVLYVDDIIVAEDVQDGLADSPGALNIGCGSNPSAKTYFSGLIDDIRIYNRVVSP